MLKKFRFGHLAWFDFEKEGGNSKAGRGPTMESNSDQIKEVIDLIVQGIELIWLRRKAQRWREKITQRCHTEIKWKFHLSFNSASLKKLF